MWKQRAEKHWLRARDRNIKFYLACASQHKKKNFTLKIINENKKTVEVEWGIAKTFLNYFQTLFSSFSPSHDDIAKCIRALEPKMTMEMNSSLLR